MITDDFFRSAIVDKKINNEYKRFRIRDNEIRLYLDDAFVNIDAKTGNGEMDNSFNWTYFPIYFLIFDSLKGYR